MTDRPILFSGPMVRALLDGRKTQTRRGVKDVPMFSAEYDRQWRPHAIPPGGAMPDHWTWWEGPSHGPTLYHRAKIAFAPGDRLWVRETYYQRGHWAPVPGKCTKQGRQKWAFIPADDVVRFDAPAEFRLGRHTADPATVAWHKRLGRFMPRAASRLTLTVTNVRVERLQDISGSDAVAEGVRSRLPDNGIAQAEYRDLWDSINGKGAWDANPWVAAISFDVRQGNIDG